MSHQLFSTDGRFGLILQNDGNLVAYTLADNVPYWAAGVVMPDTPIPPIPPPQILPELITSDHVFKLNTGARFTVIEASDFNLLNCYLDGKDITPILAQRAGLGFNMLRVWTLFDLQSSGIGKLTLSDHPDLYTRIPDFLTLCASYGFYVEFTAYTDIMDPQHWGRLGESVQSSSNRLLEFCNEGHMPPNWQSYRPIPGVLCSHGSGLSEADPIRPWWNYETFHTNGAFEWQRKVGHNAMEYSVGADGIEASHVPILTNENTRFPDNDNSSIHAYDAAAGAALLCAGACFHSVSGKNSTLWTGLELDCAEAWAAGARSVDLACQAGPYVHRTDLEGPDILRAYERPVSGHNGVVIIHI